MKVLQIRHTYWGGASSEGFNYYTNNYECSINKDLIKYNEINFEKLPETFWLYRVNWDGNSWENAVKEVKDMGYIVVVYLDKGYKGQLAYCYK